MIALPVALALLAAAPVPTAQPAIAAAPSAEESAQGRVDRAADLIGAGKPAEAIAILDPLIAEQEKQGQGETRQVYCARSPAETIVYSGAAAREKKAAVVLGEDACYSIFLKGFALIDLNRSDEARPWLE